MKKTLLLLFAAFFAIATNAQVLFEENFDNGIPNTWQTIDNDGDGYNWMATTDFLTSWEWEDYLEYYVYGGTGNSVAVFSYDNESERSLESDDWLISPAITIPSSGSYSLKWYEMTENNDFPESYAVYVATSNTIDAFSATTPLFDGTATNDQELEMKTVSLSAYAGQTVYIAFRHLCTDSYVLYIDQLTIEAMSDTPEITLSALNIPATLSVNAESNVQGTITNASAATLNSFDITYNIDGGTNVATYHISGLNVNSFDTYSFTHNIPFTLTTPGSHTINVTVSNPNGESDDASDNVMSATVLACDNISQFPYTETFDGNYDCWQLIDNDGDGINIMAASNLFVDASSYVFGGSGDAITSLNFNTNTYQQLGSDHFVISPTVEVPDAGAIAKWYHIGLTDGDGYDVYVSTSANVDDILNLDPVETVTAANTLEEFTLSLNDYSGQSIHIVFRHNSGYLVAWDQFSISAMSETPEVELLSISIPSSVSENESFNVGGTVRNNSAATITSFKVQYSIDGNTSSIYTASGLNIEPSETYTFTHNTPATISTTGSHNISVTISEPNGTADNTDDNTVESVVSVCGIITALGYTEGFENGLGCWTAISNNTDNDENDSYGLGVDASSLTAHGGSSCFHFSSYSETDDYTQYLISPALNISSEFLFSFYYVIRSTSFPEAFQVMYSTTDSDPNSFMAIDDEIEATNTTWQEYSVAIPADAQYVAIKYTVSDAMWFLGIDDISFSENVIPVTYTITVVSDNTNMGTVIGGNTYTEGETCTITATANPGYHFVRWNENITTNPYTFTVTGDATYTAYFEENSNTDVYYTITVVSDNTDMGTVTGGGQVIEHGSASFSATANPGYHFLRWNDNNTDNPRTVTDVTADATYTAYFEENSGTEVYYTITVVSDNTDMGTVSGGGQVIENGSTSISATAKPGYRFVRWNDNNTDNPRSITNVTANATYTAYFEADAPQQGIDDVAAANVKIYPNPTNGMVYIEVEGLQKIEVIDAVGRVVLSQDNGTVNMSNLSNGIYSVRIHANGNTAIKKVVKR